MFLGWQTSWTTSAPPRSTDLPPIVLLLMTCLELGCVKCRGHLHLSRTRSSWKMGPATQLFHFYGDNFSCFSASHNISNSKLVLFYHCNCPFWLSLSPPIVLSSSPRELNGNIKLEIFTKSSPLKLIWNGKQSLKAFRILSQISISRKLNQLCGNEGE